MWINAEGGRDKPEPAGLSGLPTRWKKKKGKKKRKQAARRGQSGEDEPRAREGAASRSLNGPHTGARTDIYLPGGGVKLRCRRRITRFWVQESPPPVRRSRRLSRCPRPTAGCSIMAGS